LVEWILRFRSPSVKLVVLKLEGNVSAEALISGA